MMRSVPANPYRSSAARISGGTAKLPRPLPATDSPLANARRRAKYWPTVTMVGEYANAEPTPEMQREQRLKYNDGGKNLPSPQHAECFLRAAQVAFGCVLVLGSAERE